MSAIVDLMGRWASWLCLPVVLLLFLQLPLRDIVHAGNNADNDFGQIVFANSFMVGIPFTVTMPMSGSTFFISISARGGGRSSSSPARQCSPCPGSLSSAAC